MDLHSRIENKSAAVLKFAVSAATSVGLLAASLTVGVSSAAAAVGDISAFSTGANSTPQDVVSGPDGNLWVTATGINSIVKVSQAGAILASYPVPTANSGLREITVGPDNNLWFTMTSANKIGRMTTSGAVTEFSVPTANSQPWGITAGPDGALWFTQFAGNKIGRVSTAGQVTNEFSVPTAEAGLWGITAGPEGSNRLYFTESAKGKVGFITVTGQIREIALASNSAEPRGITVVNGSVWFAMHGSNSMGNLITDSTVASITLGQAPSEMTVGPGNSMWVTTGSNSIVNLSSQAVLQGTYTFPTANSRPTGITRGPDGNIWAALAGANSIARLVSGQVLTSTRVPVVTASSPVVPGTVISASNGEWNFQATSFTYQWQRCSTDQTTSCVVIPGETRSSYTVTTADNGQRIRAGVIAASGSGPSTPAFSTVIPVGSTAPVPAPVPAPAPTPAPAPLPAGVVSVGGGATMEIDGPFRHKRGKARVYDVVFSSTAVSGTVTVTFNKPNTARKKVFVNVPVSNGVAALRWKAPRRWPLTRTAITATFTPSAGSVWTSATATDRVRITR